MASILLVDDDEQLLYTAQAMLERLQHDVVTARNGNEALARYVEHAPDLVITDLIMPDREGLETIRELRRSAPGVKIIAMSGGGRSSPGNYLKMAKDLGATAVLAKPFSFSELATVVDTLLAVRQKVGSTRG